LTIAAEEGLHVCENLPIPDFGDIDPSAGSIVFTNIDVFDGVNNGVMRDAKVLPVGGTIFPRGAWQRAGAERRLRLSDVIHAATCGARNLVGSTAVWRTRIYRVAGSPRQLAHSAT
jgi:hypothetical protein